jgi:hypothetical protein
MKSMKQVKRYLIELFLLLLIVFIAFRDKQQAFSLSVLKPVILKENVAEIFQYWELKNTALLWDTNFLLPHHIKFYSDSLHGIYGHDYIQTMIKKMALQDRAFKKVNTQNGDAINAQLIHAKVIGKIRPINYLEAELLNYQLSRYPLLSHPTEFHGFILQHDSLNLVRVYFAASDQPWPPKPNVILNAIKNDLKTGWTFNYHLHNHYEPKAHQYLGILAPSTTDAQFYAFLSESFHLKNAIITNGFHTVEIKNEEFDQLKTPEGH